MPFLTLPSLDNSIAIFGSGYANQLLKNIAWLAKCPIFYWGDMDVDGFKILAQLRSHFPQTQSLMMNRQTYDAFQSFAVTVKPQVPEVLDCLSVPEQALCHYLAVQGLRLEQERIRQETVNTCLTQLA